MSLEPTFPQRNLSSLFDHCYSLQASTCKRHSCLHTHVAFVHYFNVYVYLRFIGVNQADVQLIIVLTTNFAVTVNRLHSKHMPTRTSVNSAVIADIEMNGVLNRKNLICIGAVHSDERKLLFHPEDLKAEQGNKLDQPRTNFCACNCCSGMPNRDYGYGVRAFIQQKANKQPYLLNYLLKLSFIRNLF